MTAQQRIARVRRNYNQWVANQTLEDYALRFTAKSARKWSSARVANTAIGAVSFLALEAIGGSIAINYGFVNATVAILIVGGLTSSQVCRSPTMHRLTASTSIFSRAARGSAISARPSPR
jgi:hypothetical protein